MEISVSKNTTIFSSNKLPAACVAALLLLILTEALIYVNRPLFIKDYWNKFLINEHSLIDQKRDYDYLIIGDSIQKTGIDPLKVDNDLLSLGLPGGKPMSQYLLLDRYLKTHKPPKAIFLYIDPEAPMDSLFVILRYFVSIPEAITIWRDLKWSEKQIYLMKFWASLDLRKTGLIKRAEYSGTNTKFLDTMIANRGYMPIPDADKSIGDDYFKNHKDRYQRAISFSKNDLKYLDKLTALAESKKIRVVFIGFVLPKELHDILEISGFNKSYWAFFKYLQVRYKKAYFVKQNIMFLDNKYFGDQAHVNNEGSEIYTEYFKNKIFMPMKAAIENIAVKADN